MRDEDESFVVSIFVHFGPERLMSVISAVHDEVVNTSVDP